MVTGTVSLFVDLILKHRGKRGQLRARLKSLSFKERDVLLRLVQDAGFSADRLVRGKVVGHIGAKREKFLINNVCPFKVVDRDGGDLYFATGFLNCAIWYAGEPKVLRRKKRAEIVGYLETAVEDSRPFDPIRLNQKGDFMVSFARAAKSFSRPPYFVGRLKDHDEIGTSIIAGVHAGCGGPMCYSPGKLTCRSCDLLVAVPLDVVTYGDIRKALQVT